MVEDNPVAMQVTFQSQNIDIPSVVVQMQFFCCSVSKVSVILIH